MVFPFKLASVTGASIFVMVDLTLCFAGTSGIGLSITFSSSVILSCCLLTTSVSFGQQRDPTAIGCLKNACHPVPGSAQFGALVIFSSAFCSSFSDPDLPNFDLNLPPEEDDDEEVENYDSQSDVTFLLGDLASLVLGEGGSLGISDPFDVWFGCDAVYWRTVHCFILILSK